MPSLDERLVTRMLELHAMGIETIRARDLDDVTIQPSPHLSRLFDQGLLWRTGTRQRYSYRVSMQARERFEV